VLLGEALGRDAAEREGPRVDMHRIGEKLEHSLLVSKPDEGPA
jgi:hypothetical protein